MVRSSRARKRYERQGVLVEESALERAEQECPACHTVLAVEGRVALTLRVACGLTTAEIARSFLVP